MRPNRCDCCGDKFGLVSHSSWNRRFCSRLCRRVYQFDKFRSARWADFVGKVARGLDRLKFTVEKSQSA